MFNSIPVQVQFESEGLDSPTLCFLIVKHLLAVKMQEYTESRYIDLHNHRVEVNPLKKSLRNTCEQKLVVDNENVNCQRSQFQDRMSLRFLISEWT